MRYPRCHRHRVLLRHELRRHLHGRRRHRELPIAGDGLRALRPRRIRVRVGQLLQLVARLRRRRHLHRGALGRLRHRHRHRPVRYPCRHRHRVLRRLKLHRHRLPIRRQRHLATLRSIAILAHRVAVLRACRQPLEPLHAVGTRRLRILLPRGARHRHRCARHRLAVRVHHHEGGRRRFRPHRLQRDVAVHRLAKVVRLVVQQPLLERVATFGGDLHLRLLDRLAFRHRYSPLIVATLKPPAICVEQHLARLRQVDHVGNRLAIRIHQYHHRAINVAGRLGHHRVRDIPTAQQVLQRHLPIIVVGRGRLRTHRHRRAFNAVFTLRVHHLHRDILDVIEDYNYTIEPIDHLHRRHYLGSIAVNGCFHGHRPRGQHRHSRKTHIIPLCCLRKLLPIHIHHHRLESIHTSTTYFIFPKPDLHFRQPRQLDRVQE